MIFFSPQPADNICHCVSVLEGKNDPNKEKIIPHTNPLPPLIINIL